MKINTNSWHYRFQDMMGLDPHDRRDFCGYFSGLILAIALIILAASLFAAVLVFMAFLGAGLIYGYREDSTITLQFYEWIISGFVGFVATTGFFVGIVLVVSAPTVVKSKARRNTPNFIRERYRSWKEKTCMLIEFEDGKND